MAFAQKYPADWSLYHAVLPSIIKPEVQFKAHKKHLLMPFILWLFHCWSPSDTWCCMGSPLGKFRFISLPWTKCLLMKQQNVVTHSGSPIHSCKVLVLRGFCYWSPMLHYICVALLVCYYFMSDRRQNWFNTVSPGCHGYKKEQHGSFYMTRAFIWSRSPVNTLRWADGAWGILGV